MKILGTLRLGFISVLILLVAVHFRATDGAPASHLQKRFLGDVLGKIPVGPILEGVVGGSLQQLAQPQIITHQQPAGEQPKKKKKKKKKRKRKKKKKTKEEED